MISINEPSEDTPTGRLLEGIIESLDEFYSDNLGQEVSRGMKESVSRGFYIARKPPYGYSKIKVKDGEHERTKLALDQAQADIVKSMFTDALAGTGITDIVRNLNDRSVPSPKGKGWNKSESTSSCPTRYIRGPWSGESRQNDLSSHFVSRITARPS